MGTMGYGLYFIKYFVVFTTDYMYNAGIINKR